MFEQPLLRTIRRYQTLHTHRIGILPIVILMPHSGCNCKCIMCDIWKGNAQARQLKESDLAALLPSLRRLDTRLVVMSGGEALLNPSFFRLCEILKDNGIAVSLLSTGLLLQRHTDNLVKWVSDIVVSLDGHPSLHDTIRNIPGAFSKMQTGIESLRQAAPGYPVTARCVIHRLNFRHWPSIVETAKSLQLNSISFLPADTTSQAFNRTTRWDSERQGDLLPAEAELPVMQAVIDNLVADYTPEINNGFIAESVQKIQAIQYYYAAMHGNRPFPYKKCNAPWVSTVVEADGTVKPCFFHDSIGNIHNSDLNTILNSPGAIQFRKQLDMSADATCTRCVCSLYVSPSTAIPAKS